MLKGISLPMSLNFCHCSRCRHISGALCATYAYLPIGSAKPDSALLNSLSQYESSKGHIRYFCSTCGAHVFTYTPKDLSWKIASGTLEKLDGVARSDRHIMIESTGDGGSSDWLTEVEGQRVKRWASVPIPLLGSELPLGWHDPKRTSHNKDPSKRLHAHCDCGGVRFYIAHPSAQSAETSSPWPDLLVSYHSGPPSLPENETWWLRSNKQKFLAGVCTCDSCRLATGFEFIEWAFVPTVDITLDAEGKEPFKREFGTLKAHRSSDKATRRFCGKCGATVFWDGDVRPGLIDVACGLLDAEEGVRAEEWLEWRTERVSFREDAVKRANALTLGLEEGLKVWGEKEQGRKGPAEEVKKVQESKF
ncbi:hypothetical protein H2203_000557 [Taxawa tesnikishii (nom. ined.)]|nr:hypothetical protein H2203_000557 [Dothideales sp. JES 119]